MKWYDDNGRNENYDTNVAQSFSVLVQHLVPQPKLMGVNIAKIQGSDGFRNTKKKLWLGSYTKSMTRLQQAGHSQCKASLQGLTCKHHSKYKIFPWVLWVFLYGQTYLHDANISFLVSTSIHTSSVYICAISSQSLTSCCLIC